MLSKAPHIHGRQGRTLSLHCRGRQSGDQSARIASFQWLSSVVAYLVVCWWLYSDYICRTARCSSQLSSNIAYILVKSFKLCVFGGPKVVSSELRSMLKFQLLVGFNVPTRRR